MTHPDPETLAAHVEGRLAPDQAEAVRAHLVACRQCADLWADTAVFHLKAAAPRRARVPRRRIGIGVATALAASIVFAIALGLPDAPVREGETLAPGLRAIFESNRDAASIRSLVLPDAPAYAPTPVYRSTENGGDLGDVVDALRTANAPGDAAVAADLAVALLLDTNADAASLVVERALRDHPDDRDLRLIGAVVAFHRSDLDRAESDLRTILARDPSDEIAALNLGLVLMEGARRDEAREVLDRLAREAVREDVRGRASYLSAPRD